MALHHKDLTAGIIAFEQGTLTDDETDELFQYLVDSGLAWALQGFYGRTAVALIEAGRVRDPRAVPATQRTTARTEDDILDGIGG